MRDEHDPERALERMGDELEERKQRLDDQLDEARQRLAERAADARHLGEAERLAGNFKDADESDPTHPGDDPSGAGKSEDAER